MPIWGFELKVLSGTDSKTNLRDPWEGMWFSWQNDESIRKMCLILEWRGCEGGWRRRSTRIQMCSHAIVSVRPKWKFIALAVMMSEERDIQECSTYKTKISGEEWVLDTSGLSNIYSPILDNCPLTCSKRQSFKLDKAYLWGQEFFFFLIKWFFFFFL